MPNTYIMTITSENEQDLIKLRQALLENDPKLVARAGGYGKLLSKLYSTLKCEVSEIDAI